MSLHKAIVWAAMERIINDVRGHLGYLEYWNKLDNKKEFLSTVREMVKGLQEDLGAFEKNDN